MSSADSNELPVVETPSPPCRHLRNKGMYVYTDGQLGESHDDYDNTIYWCMKTSNGFGPDDELVDREDCSKASRTCYEPF
jgi:hypothetical protein